MVKNIWSIKRAGSLHYIIVLLQELVLTKKLCCSNAFFAVCFFKATSIKKELKEQAIVFIYIPHFFHMKKEK